MLTDVGESWAETKLPPSERDFEVYRVTVLDGDTTREAAVQFGLSQSRIMQLRKRVVEFIGREVPECELEPHEKLRVAENIAEERFYALYSESMTAWRKSQGQKTTIRENGTGETKITREEQGNPKFLQQALRVTVAQGRFAAALVKDAEAARRGEEERERRRERETERQREREKDTKEVSDPNSPVEEGYFNTPFVCPPPGWCSFQTPGSKEPCPYCPTMLARKANEERASIAAAAVSASRPTAAQGTVQSGAKGGEGMRS